MLGDGSAVAVALVSDWLGVGVPSPAVSLADVLTEALGAVVVSLVDSLWDGDAPVDGSVVGSPVEVLLDVAVGDGDASPSA
ncbi:hypothetical protein GCM10022384_03920 [Streptomyces marokkonensis]|uniref:Uncharacterized protein n=1 Tax=Streptomyces marokkonensis TaxID=324855 RepID=A0ABP7NTE2_9ACTN